MNRLIRQAAAEYVSPPRVLELYKAGPLNGVFTDGSCIPNPGPGGWGFVHVVNDEAVNEGHGYEPETTNNRMELRALIEALKTIPTDAETAVYSDSMLCVNTVNVWAPAWERRGWRKKTGPIKNLDLVKELVALHRERRRCRIEWIKAHASARWNEYADSLSTAWLVEQARA